MRDFEYAKMDDLPETSVSSEAGGPRLDTELFRGVWLNSDRHAAGIQRVEFATSDTQLTMHVVARSEDWGLALVEPYADSVDSRVAAKFAASYEFGTMRVDLHGWIKLGVLVISVFTEFREGSSRTNFFDRDFFFAAGSDNLP